MSNLYNLRIYNVKATRAINIAASLTKSTLKKLNCLKLTKQNHRR